MSHQYFFAEEKLKPLVTSFLNNDFEFEAVPSILRKGMRLYVHEYIPYVWLSDGYHFIEAFFTKESINEFRKNYSHMKFSALRDKILYLTKWSLKVRALNSRQCITSYQNLTFVLIIDSFKPIWNEVPSAKQVNSVNCLFKDEEMHILIRQKRHEITKLILARWALAAEIGIDLPPFESLYKEGNLDDGLELNQTSVIRCQEEPVQQEQLLQDFEDQEEFFAYFQQFDFSDEELSRLAEIRRILIQERGEEEYYYLHNKKSKLIQELLDDEFTRYDLIHQLTYLQQQSSASYFQKQQELKFKKSLEKQKQKTVKYNLGCSAKQIKEKILRFITTFNPSPEQALMEGRPRSYSQDNNAEEGDKLETKSISCREAMSQFVCHQRSELNHYSDSEGDDEEFDQDCNLSKERVKLLQSSVQDMSISFYRKYLQWFAEHQVISNDNYIMIKSQQQEAETQLTEVTKVCSQNDTEVNTERLNDLDYLVGEERDDLEKDLVRKRLFEEESGIDAGEREQLDQEARKLDLTKKRLRAAYHIDYDEQKLDDEFEDKQELMYYANLNHKQNKRRRIL